MNFQEFLWKLQYKTKVFFKVDETSSEANISNSILKNGLFIVLKLSFPYSLYSILVFFPFHSFSHIVSHKFTDAHR